MKYMSRKRTNNYRMTLYNDINLVNIYHNTKIKTTNVLIKIMYIYTS